MERTCRSCASGVVSFFVGALLGAGAALLMAPKSGKETREQIRGMAESAKDTTEDYYERVKKTVVSALEDGEGFFEEKKQAIAKAVRAGIETYQKTRKHTEDTQSTTEPPTP